MGGWKVETSWPISHFTQHATLESENVGLFYFVPSISINTVDLKYTPIHSPFHNFPDSSSMSRESMSTFCKPVIPEAAQKNSSDTVIDLPQAAEDHFGLGRVKNATRSNCKMKAVINQFFSGPELAKMFCQVAFAAIFAIPVTYKNQMLPAGYCLAISLLLFLGFLGLLTAISVQKAFPYVAGVLVLTGTACVVSTVPIVTAGVLPDHRLFLWAFFAFFLLFIFLGFLWLHRHVFKQIPGVIKGEINAKEEIRPFLKLKLASELHNYTLRSVPEEVAKSPIPSCANEQVNSEAARAIAVGMKLDSEDVK